MESDISKICKNEATASLTLCLQPHNKTLGLLKFMLMSFFVLEFSSTTPGLKGKYLFVTSQRTCFLEEQAIAHEMDKHTIYIKYRLFQHQMLLEPGLQL